jgi:hypothetical protein
LFNGVGEVSISCDGVAAGHLSVTAADDLSSACLEKQSSIIIIIIKTNKTKQTPWSESASELYRPSDRRFSAK